ncbi:DUF4019 domain-containing protein [Edaphobacter flagellatus]|uniref:DUF4019 domain-containing protein n=1 Tax=Edaphobacter flagellatus TaxID=1933044 RepID=UPI0021B4B50A|nr:DUF4019 domain-containing protein [Edaphobacter flagellatus]
MWLWIGLGVFLMGAGIAWFAHMMVGGYRQTSALIATLHNQMSRQDWDAIYNEAASGYREELTADQNRQIFEGIERKLGSPVSTKQKSFFINTNNGVTVVTASFETTFSGNATATETIVWRSYGGSFRLYSYNINSIDLITR